MTTLTKESLLQFTGTAEWYRHLLYPSVVYTDGAKHIAEAGGAYWLLDEIAFHQGVKEIQAEPFQTWTLTVRPDHVATLTCTDGNDNELFSKIIPFTDFPLDEITLWVESDVKFRVILLPSEH